MYNVTAHIQTPVRQGKGRLRRGQQDTLGAYLADARMHQGLSQQALGARLRTRTGGPLLGPAISQIERGLRYPLPEELLAQLAWALGVSVHELWELNGGGSGEGQ